MPTVAEFLKEREKGPEVSPGNGQAQPIAPTVDEFLKTRAAPMPSGVSEFLKQRAEAPPVAQAAPPVAPVAAPAADEFAEGILAELQGTGPAFRAAWTARGTQETQRWASAWADAWPTAAPEERTRTAQKALSYEQAGMLGLPTETEPRHATDLELQMLQEAPGLTESDRLRVERISRARAGELAEVVRGTAYVASGLLNPFGLGDRLIPGLAEYARKEEATILEPWGVPLQKSYREMAAFLPAIAAIGGLFKGVAKLSPLAWQALEKVPGLGRAMPAIEKVLTFSKLAEKAPVTAKIAATVIKQAAQAQPVAAAVTALSAVGEDMTWDQAIRRYGENAIAFALISTLYGVAPYAYKDVRQAVRLEVWGKALWAEAQAYRAGKGDIEKIADLTRRGLGELSKAGDAPAKADIGRFLTSMEARLIRARALAKQRGISATDAWRELQKGPPTGLPAAAPPAAEAPSAAAQAVAALDPQTLKMFAEKGSTSRAAVKGPVGAALREAGGDPAKQADRSAMLDAAKEAVAGRGIEAAPAPPAPGVQPAPPAPAEAAAPAVIEQTFTTKMQAAKSADEGRDIIAEHTDAVHALEKAIGIEPNVGRGAKGFAYVGFSVIKPAEWRKVIKAAKSKDPAAGERLQVLVDDGHAMVPAWEALLKKETAEVYRPPGAAPALPPAEKVAPAVGAEAAPKDVADHIQAALRAIGLQRADVTIRWSDKNEISAVGKKITVPSVLRGDKRQLVRSIAHEGEHLRLTKTGEIKDLSAAEVEARARAAENKAELAVFGNLAAEARPPVGAAPEVAPPTMPGVPAEAVEAPKPPVAAPRSRVLEEQYREFAVEQDYDPVTLSVADARALLGAADVEGMFDRADFVGWLQQQATKESTREFLAGEAAKKEVERERPPEGEVVEPARVEERAPGEPVAAEPTVPAREPRWPDLDPTDPADAKRILKEFSEIEEHIWPRLGPLRQIPGALTAADHAAVDAAFRTAGVPIETGDETVKLWAIPGKEAALKAVAAKIGRVREKKIGVKPKARPKARAKRVILPPRAKDTAAKVLAMRSATAREDTRYALQAALVDGKNLVVTDGRRLWIAQGDWGKKDGIYDIEADGNLRKRPPKIAGVFPKYQDVVPFDVAHEIRKPLAEINIEETLRRLRQAETMTSEESRGVLVVLNQYDGSLGFASSTVNVGTAEVNVQTTYKELFAVDPTFFRQQLEWHYRFGDDTVFINQPKKKGQVSAGLPITTYGVQGKTVGMLMPISVEAGAIRIEPTPPPPAPVEAVPPAKPPKKPPKAKAPAEAKPSAPPEKPPPPPEAPPAPVVPEPKPTSIKNAVVDEERVARGLPPMEAPLRHKWGKAVDEAMAEIRSNPNRSQELLDQLVAGPRAMTDVEGAILDIRKVTLHNERARIDEQGIEAQGRGDQETIDENRIRAERISDELAQIDQAGKAGGTETARGLAFRRALMAEDYSLAAMETRTRAAQDYKPLSAEQAAEIKSLHDRLAAKERELADYIAKTEAAQRERVHGEIGRPRPKGVRAPAPSGQVVEKIQAAVADGKDLAELGSFVQRLAQSFVAEGVTERDALIDAVHAVLQEIDPAITRRETMDAISGYGEYRLLSRNEIKVQLRDLKGQMQQIAKLEDMVARRAPLKTGFERRTPSAKERHLIQQVNEARRRGGYEVIDPKMQLPAALDSIKTRLRNQISDLELKLAEGDFETRPRPKLIELDAEAVRLRFEAETVKRKWREGNWRLRMSRRTILQKIGAGFRETLQLPRAIKTSLDLSAVLRQGAFVVFGHPIRGLRQIPAMMRAAAPGRWGERQMFKIDQAIRSDPMYALSVRCGLDLTEFGQDLTRMEEVYMSRYVEKIPLVAASARAYVTYLNKLRFEHFKALVRTLGKTGEVTLDEGRAIAGYVNSATGRATFRRSNALVNLNSVFFAPRYVASRFQLLMGQPLWRGTWRTRRIIAAEYARFLIGLGLVYTLGWLADADFEWDPRSADFGKIRFGNTRVDPLAGLAQVTVFISRVITGKTKTAAGRVVPIRGEEVPYGRGTAADVTARFLRTKLSPVPAVTLDIAAGEDVVGRPITPATVGKGLLAPMAIQDIYEAMIDQGIPRGAALGILAFFGMGLQTYETRGPKKPKPPERLARPRRP